MSTRPINFHAKITLRSAFNSLEGGLLAYNILTYFVAY